MNVPLLPLKSIGLNYDENNDMPMCLVQFFLIFHM